MNAGDSDWRLFNQEKYLAGVTLQRKKYKKYSETWEHDHCSFCWAKFMETASPDILTEGYATADNYYWVCPRCFEDFKARFRWQLIE